MNFLSIIKTKKNKFIMISSAVLIIASCTTAVLYSLFSEPSYFGPIEVFNSHEIFKSEEEYNSYISEKVALKGIYFEKIKIESGDNFWKIAKDKGINIDTLLALNPFWKSINASTGQEIITSNQKGNLCFVNRKITDKEALEIFESEPEKILFSDNPIIVTANDKETKYFPVFVIDAKPSTDNMTESMASQYTLREKFTSPLGGRFSSYFGGRVHPIFNRYGFHNGIDIAAPYGTPVGASCGGTVQSTGWMGGYGKAVIIVHEDGYKTLYGHLSSIAVRPGQTVKPNQFVGRVGSTGYSTGPHLHFTLWQNDKLINPLKVLW
ncbi:MAG TPA: M23 family metallopeptidase [Spirochaetota bacterium]|nr:M23 family metallopeptidase [Spirochaetota bacterium]